MWTSRWTPTSASTTRERRKRLDELSKKEMTKGRGKETNIVDNLARNRYAALELKMEAEVRRLSARFSSSAHSSSSSTASSSTANANGNIAVLGGICTNVPEEEAISIARAFLTHAVVLPSVPPEAPFRLTCGVHLRFGCPEDARSFVSAVRDLLWGTYDGREPWATFRHTKERRTRNRRRLLRAAEILQRHSKLAGVKKKTAFNLVCWRSSSVVLGNRRIVEVREPDNNYHGSRAGAVATSTTRRWTPSSPRCCPSSDVLCWLPSAVCHASQWGCGFGAGKRAAAS